MRDITRHVRARIGSSGGCGAVGCRGARNCHGLLGSSGKVFCVRACCGNAVSAPRYEVAAEVKICRAASSTVQNNISKGKVDTAMLLRLPGPPCGPIHGHPGPLWLVAVRSGQTKDQKRE